MTTRYWVEKAVLTDVFHAVEKHRIVETTSDGDLFLWSNKGRIPDVGEMVHVIVNGFGDAKVVGYFEEDGYYGVICEPVKLPDWYVRQWEGRELARPLHGWEQICVFGAEIKERCSDGC